MNEKLGDICHFGRETLRASKQSHVPLFLLSQGPEIPQVCSDGLNPGIKTLRSGALAGPKCSCHMNDREVFGCKQT